AKLASLRTLALIISAFGTLGCACTLLASRRRRAGAATSGSRQCSTAQLLRNQPPTVGSRIRASRLAHPSCASNSSVSTPQASIHGQLRSPEAERRRWAFPRVRLPARTRDWRAKRGVNTSCEKSSGGALAG